MSETMKELPERPGLKPVRVKQRRSGSSRRHRRRRWWRRFSALVVFLALLPVGLFGMAAMVVYGKPMAVVSLAACGLIGWALYVNDQKGFHRSKEMRRAYDPRSHFNALEVVILLGLILMNVLVMAYVFVAR